MLNEALKKLRKVAAKQKPDEYNKTKVLWRGMKDMTGVQADRRDRACAHVDDRRRPGATHDTTHTHA